MGANQSSAPPDEMDLHASDPFYSGDDDESQSQSELSAPVAPQAPPSALTVFQQQETHISSLSQQVADLTEELNALRASDLAQEVADLRAQLEASNMDLSSLRQRLLRQGASTSTVSLGW